ncbi:hypothetical protein [Aliarcobacter cryaerophilus]|uniref:hypothetical protein n=1 Tax=Aliarcobacter cryaerophilus TaxID=28198 RepID=UPI00112F2F83|nr:hypothetical protein [Aliarcobacter cryaerophilus]
MENKEELLKLEIEKLKLENKNLKNTKLTVFPINDFPVYENKVIKSSSHSHSYKKETPFERLDSVFSSIIAKLAMIIAIIYLCGAFFSFFSLLQ